MARTAELVAGRASGVKPYFERAIQDEKVREDVRDAIAAAREIYDELIGGRGVATIATRVATDKDIQDNLKRAVDDLRKAAERVQGKESHAARNTLLLTGIVIGVLFNPVTGPATREWLKGLVGGGSSSSADFDEPSINGS